MVDLKIAVIGAGAMGSLLGYYLQRGGADVTLVVRRQAMADSFASPGISVKTYGEEGPAPEPAPMKAAVGAEGLGKQDAVLIMVKGPDTRAALETAKPVLSENTKVITLQNGIGNVDIIAEAVPRENIFCGCLNMSAIMEAPGVLTSGLFGETNVCLGSAVKGEEQKRFGAELCSLFRAGGITAEYTEDIDAEIWYKLLVNVAVNAGCALVRLRGGEAGADPQFTLMAIDMIKETIAVAAACGVKLDFGYFMSQVLPSARKSSGAHYPSLAQDVMMTKSKTEIDFLNGAVERLGAEHGVPTPVNTTVSRLIRTIENNYDKQYAPKAEKAKSGPAFRITVNEKFCKGCGFCVKYCPRGVLAISEKSGGKGYRTAAPAAEEKCVGCLSCAAVCPEAAIRIEKEG